LSKMLKDDTVHEQIMKGGKKKGSDKKNSKK